MLYQRYDFTASYQTKRKSSTSKLENEKESANTEQGKKFLSLFNEIFCYIIGKNLFSSVENSLFVHSETNSGQLMMSELHEIKKFFLPIAVCKLLEKV